MDKAVPEVFRIGVQKTQRGIRNSVILPTLSYASETWTWNAAQQSQIQAVEMSYMRGACVVSRWDREITDAP